MAIAHSRLLTIVTACGRTSLHGKDHNNVNWKLFYFVYWMGGGVGMANLHIYLHIKCQNIIKKCAFIPWALRISSSDAQTLCRETQI